MDNKFEFQTGDIISSARKITINPRTWISGLIRLATKSWVSHSSIALVMEGQVFIVESDHGPNGGGGKISPVEKWAVGKKYVVYRPYIPVETSLVLHHLPRIKYDYENTLIKQPIMQLFNKWIGKTGEGDNKFNCSEFIAWLYGYEKSYKITPSWLFRHLHQLDGSTVYATE